MDELDFLLSVSDDTRQGALRYRLAGSTAFVGEPSHVPQLVSLPELLRSSDELASDEDPAAAVKQLLDTGTTGLGGARPKASVRLEDGALAVAKFPHGSDQWDVMAWEATALDLLEAAGIGHLLGGSPESGSAACSSCGGSTAGPMGTVSATSVRRRLSVHPPVTTATMQRSRGP